MRRFLILGGTAWLGREIARQALAQGFDVTCLARGDSGEVAEGARLVRADRTAADAYEQLNGEWDEVVELSYEPELVASALEALAARAEHWTLVSSVSVYARTDEPGADETAELVEPRDLSEYPDAKVAAERASEEALGERLLIVRPGLIVGPGDPSDRFSYWPARFARGGGVLVPTFQDRFVQVIDVADLAAWIVRAGTESHTGVVNGVGAVHTMADFFEALRDVTDFQGELITVDDAALLENGVNYWAGPHSLPLWLPADTHSGFARHDGARFLASGGKLSPLEETLRRTLDDELRRGLDRPRRSGLTAAEEQVILQRAG